MSEASWPTNVVADKGEQRACREAGCHDFTEPVIVRQGAHVLHASVEVAVSFCRRCGAVISLGWHDGGDGGL